MSDLESPPLEAGRELDALVAEKVMGWTTYSEYVHGPLMHGGANMLLYRGSEHNGRTWSVDAFKPSTDISAAWEVVEKMISPNRAESFWQLDSLGFPGEQWRVCFSADFAYDDRRFIYADAETAPLAICLAALKAMESQ